MSELAAKLARRRMLNGEQPQGETVPAANLMKPPQSDATASAASSNELTSKLARRRQLNGEQVKEGPKTNAPGKARSDPTDMPVPKPSIAPSVSTPVEEASAEEGPVAEIPADIVSKIDCAAVNHTADSKCDALPALHNAHEDCAVTNVHTTANISTTDSAKETHDIVAPLDEDRPVSDTLATVASDTFLPAERLPAPVCDEVATSEILPETTETAAVITTEHVSVSAESDVQVQTAESPTQDTNASEIQSAAVPSIANGATSTVDPLDDFADIESFLGSMNDQTSQLLGGVDTLLSSSRVVNKTVMRNGGSLFDDEVVREDGAQVNSMGTSELQKQNDQLTSQLKFLKAEIHAREKTIDKLTTEMQHLREELRHISADGSPRVSKKSVEQAPSPESSDLFSSTSDHHIADELFSIPSLSRPSQARKSNLFSADDDEGDSGIGHVSAPAMNELTKENTKLRNEVAMLTNDLRNRDSAVMQMRREKSDLLGTLAHEREILERRSGRRSSSAKGVLKNQLDLMGFGSSEVEFAVEALQEVSVLTDNVEDSMQSLFSSPKLHSSRSESAATYGLDSTWNMSQNGLFSRGHAADDSAATKTSSVSARQRLNDHGLFSSDVRSVSTEGKNEFLFKDDVPTHDEPPKPRPNNTSVSDNKDFVYRLMSAECSDLVEVIRRFLLTIYGPNGDCTPPDRKTKLTYVFHGTRDMASRCCDFFDAMIEHFGSHPAWADETEERMKSARDCLEKYVMNKIADIAFKSVEVPDEDEALLRKMKCLSFVPASALDIKDEMNNDIVWALARDELRKINSYRTPGEKIDCIVRCAAVIFRTLNLARAKSGDSPAGADDFLPIFIYVVMHSQVPQLVTNCEYIQCFHNPDNLRSKAGYCFVNLRSAMEFILHLDGEGLTMDRDEFCAKLAQAEKDYDKSCR